MAGPDLHDIALLAARTAALAITKIEPTALGTTTKAGHENYLTAADLAAERAIIDMASSVLAVLVGCEHELHVPVLRVETRRHRPIMALNALCDDALHLDDYEQSEILTTIPWSGRTVGRRLRLRRMASDRRSGIMNGRGLGC